MFGMADPPLPTKQQPLEKKKRKRKIFLFAGHDPGSMNHCRPVYLHAQKVLASKPDCDWTCVLRCVRRVMDDGKSAPFRLREARKVLKEVC